MAIVGFKRPVDFYRGIIRPVSQRPGQSEQLDAPATGTGVAAQAAVPKTADDLRWREQAAHLVERAHLGDAVRTPEQKAAAVRALIGHAQKVGASLEGDVVENIRKAELANGMAADSRVSEADLARAIARSARAMRIQPTPHTSLYAFTRLVDAKFQLTPEVISAMAADIGKAHPDALIGAIEDGPPVEKSKDQEGIAWAKPETKAQLVASLVRWMTSEKKRGAPLQITISDDLAGWIEELSKDKQGQLDLKLAMGGAGAFGANVAATFKGLAVRFFSKEPLPGGVADRFGPTVQVVGGAGVAEPMAQRANDSLKARVNFSAEYQVDVNDPHKNTFTILGRPAMTMHFPGEPPRVVPFSILATGRVILSTKSADDVVPGFDGLGDETLRRMGRDHDFLFDVGLHYRTAGKPSEMEAVGKEHRRQLRLLREGNPHIWLHYGYVVPKLPDNEAALLSELRGVFTSTGMNRTEAPGLIHRLYEAGLSGVDANPNMPAALADEPKSLIAHARAIRDALQLETSWVRGNLGDVCVMKEPIDAARAERVIDSFLRARQMAAMKNAISSGEIKSREDYVDLTAMVEGKNLAALQRFVDDLEAQAAADGLVFDRSAVLKDWCWHDPTRNEVVFFIPNHGIHDFTGGLVSTGDTIDTTIAEHLVDKSRPTDPRLSR